MVCNALTDRFELSHFISINSYGSWKFWFYSDQAPTNEVHISIANFLLMSWTKITHLWFMGTCGSFVTWLTTIDCGNISRRIWIHVAQVATGLCAMTAMVVIFTFDLYCIYARVSFDLGSTWLFSCCTLLSRHNCVISDRNEFSKVDCFQFFYSTGILPRLFAFPRRCALLYAEMVLPSCPPVKACYRIKHNLLVMIFIIGIFANLLRRLTCLLRNRTTKSLENNQIICWIILPRLTNVCSYLQVNYT